MSKSYNQAEQANKKKHSERTRVKQEKQRLKDLEDEELIRNYYSPTVPHDKEELLGPDVK